ncbi:efflux RND transporter permease subunit [Myxococcota bacterium]|nr:efflux RND transporter permease subunit [Myxococcota bacterium]
MRDQIENRLEALGHFLFHRAWWVIGVIALLLSAGVTQIHKIEFETSVDSFLPDGDPTREIYKAFLEEFGRDDLIIIAVRPSEIFDLDFLAKLRRFHQTLEEEVPHVVEVDSLINARDTRADGDTLLVGDLFEEWPETDAQLEALRERALSNPLYRDLILSRDTRLTTISLELGLASPTDSDEAVLAGFDFESDEGTTPAPLDTASMEMEAVDAVYAVVEDFEAPDFRVWVAGSPVMNSDMMMGMVADVLRFTVLSLVAISVLLMVTFRRMVGVIAPLLVALSAVLATVGLMGAVGIPFMPISELIPSFLLCVGVGGSVHLLVIFFQRLATGASREDAIAGALGHSGLPIVMTSLTTAAGVASFSAAGLVPLAVFGMLAPVGVLLTMLLSLTLAPALMAVLPLGAPRASRIGPRASIAFLSRCGALATHRGPLVLVLASLILLVGGSGLQHIQFTHNPLDWFPDDKPVKVSTQLLDQQLAGAVTMELLIDSGRENGLHEPELLERIDRLSEAALALEAHDVWVGKTISLVDIVKEIHQALNGDRPEAHAIPEQRPLVSQELLLFESSGSDDLEKVVDPSFQTARMTVKMPYLDGGKYLLFEEVVHEHLEPILGGDAELTLTGLMTVMGRSSSAAVETMARAYLLALVVITPVMMLLLGNARVGLIAMIPNLYPIILTLGLMGWLGVPLEMFSMLIGSIALGLAVDDTVHFMHGFRRSFERTLNVETAVRETLQTTGQALMFTSVVLSLGFFIYIFSSLQNLQDFGYLTAFAILVAFLGDILLAPALMAVVLRKHKNAEPAAS